MNNIVKMIVVGMVLIIAPFSTFAVDVKTPKVSQQAALQVTENSADSSKTINIANAGDNAQVIITQNGDTAVMIAKKGDGKTIIARLSSIKELLNDTILNEEDLVGDAEVDIDDVADNDSEEEERLTRRFEAVAESAGFFYDLVKAFITGVVLIIALCLLFYYLHRRRKYKMIETAISNNYALPPELFGVKTGFAPQSVQPSRDFNTVRQEQSGVADAAPSFSGVQQPLAGSDNSKSTTQAVIDNLKTIELKSMSEGYTIVAIGLGLMLFFLFRGNFGMVGMMSIILFLGLGKCAIAYQQQLQARQWQNNIKPNAPQATAANDGSGQFSTPYTPGTNNRPTTPPPFEH